MQRNPAVIGRSTQFRGLLAALVSLPVLLIPIGVFGATYKTLYSFAGGTDGAYPVAKLMLDSNGNLYGITNSGGNHECDSSLSTGCGTVFRLTRHAGASWSESVLHVFSQTIDGGNPSAAIMDAAGDLYGATQYYGPFANGTLWQLKPNAGDVWSEQILHTFRGLRDGFWCFGLSFDYRGQLSGTTYAGGTNDDGLVFHLERQSDGKWRDVVLYDFAGGANDGSSPGAAVSFAADGRLYGTTYEGGPHLTGTVFEMQHNSSGWNEKPIYIFNGLPFGKSSDGTNPSTGVIVDKAGNIYGSTNYGGPDGVGTVYELRPNGEGGWSETLLHIFTDRADVAYPGDLIFDPAGNLYSVASGRSTFGSVFKLSPTAGERWKITVLHDFKGGADGATPSGLVRDADGNFYGTTTYGGTSGFGVVFQITP
jgi:uncharacterized repeat protein (TIGR03803 family)